MLSMVTAAMGCWLLQKRRVERHLGSAARAAEKDAGAGRHESFHGRAENRGQRRRFEREAHAVAGDFPDFRDHVGAPAVIDRMGGAELACQFEAAIVHVDRDDRIASGDFCRHQGPATARHARSLSPVSRPWRPLPDPTLDRAARPLV
jgi:hypothetical protein